eukprot:scaffold60297_cov57-Phaeocystis_antarctica.AAC.2
MTNLAAIATARSAPVVPLRRRCCGCEDRSEARARCSSLAPRGPSASSARSARSARSVRSAHDCDHHSIFACAAGRRSPTARKGGAPY